MTATIELVKCSNCNHTFPVNPLKHRHRKERFCPRCKTSHEKKGWLEKKWKPSETWRKQKQLEREGRDLMKQHSPKTMKPTPFLGVPLISPLMVELIAKRKLELEKEGKT